MLLTPNGKIKKILTNLRDMKNISAFGLQKYARYALFCQCEGAVLVESDYVKAREALQFCSAFTDVIFLPARSDSIGFSLERLSTLDYDRASAIADIVKKKSVNVITYVEATMQLYPKPECVENNITCVTVGEECEPTAFAHHLFSAGYRRVEQLGGVGEYALRGDIVDVSSVDGNNYRVVFDFDIIDGISVLDEGQITLYKIKSLSVPPAGETYYDDDEGAKALGDIEKEVCKLSPDAVAHFSSVLDDVRARVKARRKDIPLLLPYVDNVCSFCEYVESRPIIIADARTVYDMGELTMKEHVGRVKILTDSGDALPSALKQLLATDEALSPKSGALTFHTGLSQNRFYQPDEICELTDTLLPDYSHDYGLLVSDVRYWYKKGYEITVFTGENDLLTKYFEQNAPDVLSMLAVEQKPVADSFVLHENKQIFFSAITSRDRNTRRSKRAERIALPSVGEYVVHHTHGIGKCLAIEKLDFSGAPHDYVIIGYAEGDKLYLPVENLDSLSKYSQSGEKPPKLCRLGGGQFSRMKERVKNSIKEMSINLVELYGKRTAGTGYVYTPEPALMSDFISAFEHVDTEDQSTATEEALDDLAKGKIMDRLICGDVGFGKTEVALRVAYRVIAERKQVAFLCPTTILALQHYKTAVARMESFGIKVAMLSRMSKPDEVKQVLEGLEKGSIDLIVGTHKLLGKGVKFADLGLLILDEEQRFGVQHKEQLKTFRSNVNVLTLSATPIPRTLHMSLTGIRDISMLTTPPFERLPVRSFVSEYSDGLLTDAIMQEYARGGQSFIVYNRVHGIETFAERARALLPDLKIEVVHGQMPAETSEKVIERFANGQTDVLVATTIIENGIDIPRANTMVVINSDDLGLSQMYQLRGRIGRSNRLASAYFTYNKDRKITETALSRLEAIMQCKELGSGFTLAMRDLEIRGAGNVLGREQHGHMIQVGYETYMRLLREVIAEQSGEEVKPQKDVLVHTDFNAYIPKNYVTDENWRVKAYGSISNISNLTDLKRIESTLRDMYGAPPDEVINLLTVSFLKNVSANLGASEANLFHERGSIVFDRLKDVPEGFAISAEEMGAWTSIGEKVSICFRTGKLLIKFLCNYTK